MHINTPTNTIYIYTTKVDASPFALHLVTKDLDSIKHPSIFYVLYKKNTGCPDHSHGETLLAFDFS